MAKQTLLSMTQDILSSLDGGEVNSINDNVEAQQVARIIRSCYNTINSRANLPEHYDLFELDASGSATKPTLMTLPSTVTAIEWVKYNSIADGEDDANFRLVTLLPLSQFLDRMHGLRTSDDNVGSFEYGEATYYYQDDKAPEFYTSPDDSTLIFDSFDAEVDTTLQKSKTLCYGELSPVFLLTDTYIPDLDEKQFDLLYNESKALAFAEMKQAQHQKAEMNARKGWVHLQRTKENALHGLSDFSKMPHYGRKR